jgi:excisionase family DNA binding protein
MRNNATMMTAKIVTPAANVGLATVGEAAAFLRVGRSSVYKLMDTGQLAYVKLNKCRRVKWCDLHELVEKSLVG